MLRQAPGPVGRAYLREQRQEGRRRPDPVQRSAGQVEIEIEAVLLRPEQSVDVIADLAEPALVADGFSSKPSARAIRAMWRTSLAM